MHRIVMNVIKTCPEMTFRPDFTIEAPKPYLATSLSVFTVPVERRSSVKLPKRLAQSFDALTPLQCMIMIWQNAPSVNLGRIFLASVQHVCFAFGHPLGAFPNDRSMFVTGCANQILLRNSQTPMRR